MVLEQFRNRDQRQKRLKKSFPKKVPCVQKRVPHLGHHLVINGKVRLVYSKNI